MDGFDFRSIIKGFEHVDCDRCLDDRMHRVFFEFGKFIRSGGDYQSALGEMLFDQQMLRFITMGGDDNYQKRLLIGSFVHDLFESVAYSPMYGYENFLKNLLGEEL